MTVLWPGRKQKRRPVHSGGIMLHSRAGQIIARAWPRKRGPATHPNQIRTIDWFRQANKLAKYVDGASMARAIEITLKSGMYPRDVLLSAMKGRLYSWHDRAGKVWHSMQARQDISESLDVLAQDEGSLLVRFSDFWRRVADTTVGDVLTFKGAGIPPEWETPAGGDNYLGGALVRASGTYTLPTAVWTAIPWNTEDYDTLSLHDNVTNKERLTVPTGYNRVRLSAGLVIQTGATGFKGISIYKNGAVVAGGGMIRTPSSSSTHAYMILSTPVLVCAATDYFELMAWQSTGTNKSVYSNANAFFACELISQV